MQYPTADNVSPKQMDRLMKCVPLNCALALTLVVRVQGVWLVSLTADAGNRRRAMTIIISRMHHQESGLAIKISTLAIEGGDDDW